MCLRPLSGTNILWRKSRGLNIDVNQGVRSGYQNDTGNAPTEDEETISLGLLSRHDHGMAKHLPTAHEGAERIR
jgi:hypothetical protein